MRREINRGYNPTAPTGGMVAPKNNDIGTRIVYQHDPLESVHIITGVQNHTAQVGYVPTPFVTTTNPCGGGVTVPRYLTLEFCQEGMGGCPYGGYSGCFRVDGREPNSSDIGKSVLYTGNFSQGNNPPPTAPPNGCVMKITGITGSCGSGLGAIVENINIINPTPNPCGPQNPWVLGRQVQLQFCPTPMNPHPVHPSHLNPKPYATLDGQSITSSDIGRSVKYSPQTAQSMYKYKIVHIYNISQLQGTATPLFSTSQCPAQGGQVYGCTQPSAVNYNPQATHDDGSCIFNPRPTPTNAGPVARKGRGLSDNRMSRYRSLKG